MHPVAATPLTFLSGFILNPDIAVRLAFSVVVFVTGFLVLVREQASRTAVAFFLLAAAVANWIFGSALVFAAVDPEVALAITRTFTHFGVAFIPSLLFLFVLERIGFYRRYRPVVIAGFVLSLSFYIVFSATNWFIPTVQRYPWGYVPRFSLAALAFVAFFCALFVASGRLLVRIHKAALTKTHEKRILLFLVGLGVSCLGAVDFLPAYGLSVYSFGCYAMIGLIASASRVAIRYRFTEITPANMGAEIMETMSEGLLVLDLQGSVRLANEAASRILGVPVDELNGRAAADVPGLAQLASRFPAVLERGTETFDALMSGSGDATVRFSASAIWGRNREPSAIVCRVHDVTENVKNKAALRYEQNLLRALIENLPISIYVKDAACRKVLANPVDMSWTMEFKPDGDVIGKTDLEVFPKDVAERFLADDMSVIGTGKPLVDREESYRDPKGTERWLLTSKIPLFDESGAVIGLVGTGRDITDRKRAEEALVASLKEKDLLLQEVYHRVKNNLQIICSLISLQRSTGDESLSASRALADMESRVRSMSLVHGILYESNNFALVEFSSYVKKLCENLIAAYSVDRRRVRLSVEIADVSLALAKAIPCGLILNELIVNSFKHAFPDGRFGTIGVKMSAGGSGLVSLEVSDDGVGFAASGDGNRIKRTVGLSIVESLVNQLKGRLEIDGVGGTRVLVEFPE